MLERVWSAAATEAGRLLRPMGHYIDERVDHGDRRFVDFYAATSPVVNGPYYDLAAAWLRETGAELAVDVAGGPGNLSRRTGARVVNLDSNRFMLRRASLNGAEPVRGDAATLPLLDGSLDTAVSTGTLHTFLRHGIAGGVLREMRRVADAVLVLDYRADASPDEVAEHLRRSPAVGKLLAPGGIGQHGLEDAAEAEDLAERGGLDLMEPGPYVALTDRPEELEAAYRRW